MIDTNHPEVQFAMDAVRTAGTLARKIQHDMVTPALTKEDKSPVTVADYAVQAVVGSLIERAFPTDALVGEEDASDLRSDSAKDTVDAVVKFTSEAISYVTPGTVLEFIDRGGGEPADRFWTLDPIDGTKGFLRHDQYAVALALIENGQVKLGVLGCPNLTDGYKPEPEGSGCLCVALRGHGAYVTTLAKESDLKPLQVSDVSDGQKARVLRSYEAGHTNVDKLDDVLEVMSNDADPVRMDSQAKYGVLASGQGDLLFRLLSTSRPNYQEKIWDQAAGSIVVEEAGGRITDLSGTALDFGQGKTLAKNRGVLASNGKLHDAALAALKKAGAA